MKIAVILADIRSTYNVGAILRTCEGFGVIDIYVCGYTPYPLIEGDTRLPHIWEKITKDIHKTALGAERALSIHVIPDTLDAINMLREAGYTIVALEQNAHSVALPSYQPKNNVAILLGREVEGVSPELLTSCDDIVEIPMYGKKESFNVSVAAGIALYHLSNEALSEYTGSD
jgi:23S rRNA (guanosine2251-2'-O)-methyltransferase